MPLLCLHGRIQGRVQGVGMRRAVQAQAERLKLNGWVANRDDGEVELLVEGERSAVEALCAWLERGPPHARVEKLDLQPQAMQGLAGFVIRR